MTTRACFCNNCQGSHFLTEDRIKAHRRSYGIARTVEPRASQSTEPLVDNLSNEIWRLTLQGATSTPSSKRGDAIWEREVEKQSTPPTTPPTSTPPTTQCPPTEPDPAQVVYDDLCTLDFEIHKRKADIVDMKDKGVLDGAEYQEAWFLATLERLKNTDTSGIIASSYLKTSMMDVVSDELDGLRKWMGEKGYVRLQVPSRPLAMENVVDTKKYFDHPLKCCHPAVVMALFMVVVVNLLGHLPHDTCGYILEMLKALVKCIIEGDRKINRYDEYMINKIPTTIQTARKKLDLEPTLRIAATCPSCSAIYEPVEDPKSGVLIYPSRCGHRRYEKSNPCNARLTKNKVEKGESIRVPICPFAYQPFSEFEGRFVSRPEIEDALNRSRRFRQSGEDIWDIGEAGGMSELIGVDKKAFLDGPEDELRLIWSLSIDGFNPYMNKQAGKTASVTVTSMACLNLPPSLRHKTENLYLSNLIPKEPNQDEVNHFMSPLVQDLLHSWKHGNYYTKTSLYPNGRLVRSALLPLICDLPGARKASGTSYTTTIFSALLGDVKKEDINSFDYSQWTRRTWDAHKRAAFAWRAATSKKSRAALYKKNGIRWCELLLLPYWDPTRFVIIDTMHNLFLGLVQTHFRELLAMDIQGSDEVEPLAPATPQMMAKARKIWAKTPTRSKLSTLTITGLHSLCLELNVPLPKFKARKQRRKAPYIDALLKSATANPNDEPTVESVPHDDDDVPNVILGKKELAKIHKDISGTIRPSWHTGPPANFGTPTHGKLKADQWRSLIEFDLPVSLVQLWAKSKRQKYADSTMLLATSIRWGTSYRTSKQHADTYTSDMRAYLMSILELFPKKRLKPNHYAALRLGEFLLRFGPVHGWWMFPFERLIGVLQQVNTNNKRGELEVTMIKSFCAASNLRSLLQGSSGWSDRLKTCAPIFQKWFGDDHRGTLMTDIRSMGWNISNNLTSASDSEPCDFDPRKLENLDTDIKDAILAQNPELCFKHGKAIVRKRHTHRGLQYASHDATERDSIIFFQPKGAPSLVPGRIRQIFSIPLKDQENESTIQSHFLAVHRYVSLPNNFEDPFRQYPTFGAALWSQDISKKVEIVDLSAQKIYHGICRKWDEGTLVLKPLNRDF